MASIVDCGASRKAGDNCEVKEHDLTFCSRGYQSHCIGDERTKTAHLQEAVLIGFSVGSKEFPKMHGRLLDVRLRLFEVL
jgi:hypothetical protein